MILNHVRAEVGSAPGVVLWRNECGVATHEGRTVRYGLCRGSADLIGLREVVITQEMVGRTIAQFVAVEVKTERGRTTAEQDQFLALVRKRGGVSGVARSVSEAEQLLEVVR